MDIRYNYCINVYSALAEMWTSPPVFSRFIQIASFSRNVLSFSAVTLGTYSKQTNTHTVCNNITAKPQSSLYIQKRMLGWWDWAVCFSCVAAFWHVAGSCWVFGRQPQEAETPGPALPTSASRIVSSCRLVCDTFKHFHIYLDLHAPLFSVLSMCSSTSLDFFFFLLPSMYNAESLPFLPTPADFFSFFL